MQVKEWIRPGYLSRQVKADDRRYEFDCKNQIIVQNDVAVDLLFIGDSIIQMWELAAYFGGNGLCILNRGIGGDRTASLLHRFEADAVQLKPSVCVIMAGINDAWELEEEVWQQKPGSPLHDVLATAVKNMEQILALAAEAEMKTVVCSLLPTAMEWTGHERERQIYVQNYNAALQGLSQKYGMHFADYYPLFVSSDGYSVKKELTIEGLHPNVFGYNLMAKTLKGGAASLVSQSWK